MGRGCGFHLIPVPSPNKKLGKKISPSPPRIKNWVWNYPHTLSEWKKFSRILVPWRFLPSLILVGHKKKRLDIKVAMSSSFGFGGHNSSILFAPFKGNWLMIMAKKTLTTRMYLVLVNLQQLINIQIQVRASWNSAKTLILYWHDIWVLF